MPVIKIPETPELNTGKVRRMEPYDRNESGMFNEYFSTFLGNDEALGRRITEEAGECTARVEGEAARAQEAEDGLAREIRDEAARAQEAEGAVAAALDDEESRASAAEAGLEGRIEGEEGRARAAEEEIAVRLDVETERSSAVEGALADSILAETARAVSEEADIRVALSGEHDRAMAAEEAIRGSIEAKEGNWNNKYTRSEVDNKLAALESNIDWKEAVGTYADIAAAYPDPEDGWTVNVRDTDYTYRFNGTEWVAISANAIPKATQEVDGLLAKEDKANYDEAYGKRHIHGNQSVIDKITQALLDNWDAAYTHISDAVRHITAEERANWNDANAKKHTHNNKPVLDKITQALLDNWTAAYTHISDTVEHVTAAERTKWNAVTDKVDKAAGKQLSTNDYTTADKNKLAGIAAGAQVNVQPDWGVTDAGSDAFIKNKPPSFPPSYHAHDDRYYTEAEMNTKLAGKSDTSHSHAYSAITGKPSAFTPTAHTHPKSQITDMPTKLSQFTNDAGFITRSDVDTSQDHTHINKGILDKVTQTMLDKLAGIAEGANKYVHPTTTGNKHIPSGGASGQFLKWSASGTAVWASDNNTTYGKATQSSDGLMAKEDKKKLDRSGQVNTCLITASGWSSAAPYTQTVSVSGITSADNPIIGLDIPDGATAAQEAAMIKAFGLLSSATTGAGSITFKCISKKPEANLSLSVLIA